MSNHHGQYSPPAQLARVQRILQTAGLQLAQYPRKPLKL